MTFFEAFKHYITKHPGVKAYKPTTEEYDPEQLHDIKKKLPLEVVKSVTAEELIRTDDFIAISTITHNLYKNFYTFLAEALPDFNMKGKDIVEYFIALLNNNYKTIEVKLQDANKSMPKGSYFLQDLSNQKFQGANGAMISVKGGLESSTDSVGLICNYLRHRLEDDFENEEADPKRFAANVLDIFMLANEIATFKHSYDDVLYDHAYVKVDEYGKRISFDYDSYQNEKLKALGQNIMSDHIMYVSARNREQGKKSELLRYVTNYRVKRLKVKDGFITLEFGQGDPKHHLAFTNGTQAAIDAYYAFLDINMTLDAFKGISLAEVLGVWSALQYVCKETFELYRQDYQIIFTKEELGLIPRKIRIEDLVAYLVKLTGIKDYRMRQVLAVLAVLAVDWKGMNYIWTLPLYKIRDYYCLPFFPIINSMPYNLIESILTRGGYLLEKRGEIFEQYLYKMISEAPHQFLVECWAARRYGKGRKNKGEEIDLLVSLRDVVILAEAKCVHYSMEPQNYGNAWQRLADGAEQALKKAAYIKNHPEAFADLGDVTQKKIVPVVVTNYPIFTGMEHHGVYVTDSHSFISYFNSGFFTVREMSRGANPIRDAKFFYQTEREFSANFEGYLKNHPVKSILLRNMAVEDIPLLPTTIKPWKCTAKTATYKGNPGVDITNGPSRIIN